MFPHQLIKDVAQCQNKALKFFCVKSVTIQTFAFLWQQGKMKTFCISTEEKLTFLVFVTTILFILF